MTTTDHLERVARAAADQQTARATLATAIAEAVDAGVPIAHIADAAGVSRQTVYDLLRRREAAG